LNPILTKSYIAGAAIAACRFLKHGAADGKAIQATDASAAVLGVSVENVAAALDASVDCIKAGLAYLELGGNVTRGAILIPDANGKGVAAVITPGTEQHAGAIAEVAGAAGDLIPVQVIAGTVIATDTGIATAEVTVTTGQLLALNAVPKQLIAAPGVGKAIIVEDVQLMLDFNTVGYAGIAAGEDLSVKYTDGAGAEIAQVEATGFLDAVADEFRHVRPASAAAIEPVANAAVVLHMLVGEIITGNSPLKVRIRYRTVDVAW